MTRPAKDDNPLYGVSREYLGQRLRHARMESGLSLRELAKRIGVSASFVSQVELGRASPSIGTLYAIVSELDLSLDTILAGSADSLDPETSYGDGRAEARVPIDAEHGPSRVLTAVDFDPEASTSIEQHAVGGDFSIPGFQAAHNRPEITVGGVRWERLTSNDDSLTEFLRVTYTPGSESCPSDNLMRHGGWEYIHVLEGQLDVQVLFRTQTLQVGDSLNFDSTSPHRLSNPYDEDCVAIWVVVGRNGFHHPLHDPAGHDHRLPVSSEARPSSD